MRSEEDKKFEILTQTVYGRNQGGEGRILKRHDMKKTKEQAVSSTALPEQVAQLAQNLIGRILQEMTYHPEDFRFWIGAIDRFGQGAPSGTPAIFLESHQADMPLIIGKGGAHTNAIKIIVRMIGLRYGVQMGWRADGVKPGTAYEPRAIVVNPSLDIPYLTQLVKDICSATMKLPAQVEIKSNHLKCEANVFIRVNDNADPEARQVTDTLIESLRPLLTAIGCKNGYTILIARQQEPAARRGNQVAA